MAAHQSTVRVLRRLSLFVSTCVLAAVSLTPAYACFTIYGPDDQVIYRSMQPPVDMSPTLHQTVPVLFPRGHLVFDLERECTSRPHRNVAGADTPPLLTQQSTARALGLPYTALQRGAAVVARPPAEALRLPRAGRAQ